MENKNSVNTTLIALIVFLATALGLLGGYVIFNNVDNQDKELEENNGAQTDDNNLTYDSKYEVVKEVIEDDEFFNLYVNNKKVELPFRAFRIDCEPLADILLVSVNYIDVGAVYAIDETGNIILSVGDNKYSDDVPHISPRGEAASGGTKVDGNTFNVYSHNLGQDNVVMVCEVLKPSDIVNYTERITYLGEGKFSLPVVTEKETAADYIKENNIVCQ